MTIARNVYVISDLHVGGAYADPNAQHDARKRGFRMMTHVPELAKFINHLARLPETPTVELVINGDFIDFLAEEVGSGTDQIDPTREPEWSAFRGSRGEALAAFRAIATRDKALFTALRGFLASGKPLTILLGNHDVELCLPDVRAELEAELGPGTLRFLDDGQALDLGDVLIEHGNLFDPANVVDHDRLRVLRATYSRGFDVDDVFPPPAGSRLVAEVMNPIKVVYGFIDLLKPESEPLFALLIALEPSYRKLLDDLAGALASAARTLMPRRGVPFGLRNVSGEEDQQGALTDVSSGASALETLLGETLDPKDAAAMALLGTEDLAALDDVSGGSWTARWSLFRLLVGSDTGDLASRIQHVQAALRVLAKDQSFDDSVENARYLDAVDYLAKDGGSGKTYKAVVFGHTHHAKALVTKGGTRYLNTGTWANLMQFPSLFTDEKATKSEVEVKLKEFAEHLQTNALRPYLAFRPSYARIGLSVDGLMVDAELRDFDYTNDVL